VAKLAAVVSALVAIGAGIYMLTLQTQAQGTTIFEAIAHGIGAYFVAKGLFMGFSLLKQDDAAYHLKLLAHFASERDVQDNADPGGEDYSGLPPG
jgi:hypothetical protein